MEHCESGTHYPFPIQIPPLALLHKEAYSDSKVRIYVYVGMHSLVLGWQRGEMFKIVARPYNYNYMNYRN